MFPACDGVVLIEQGGAGISSLECGACSYRFCGNCDLGPHSPAICAHVAKWVDKGGIYECSQDELDAITLKQKTTKPCPVSATSVDSSQCSCQLEGGC